MDADAQGTGLRLVLAGGVAHGRALLRRAAALTPKVRAGAAWRAAWWPRRSHAPVARLVRVAARFLAPRMPDDGAQAAATRGVGAARFVGPAAVRGIRFMVPVSVPRVARTASLTTPMLPRRVAVAPLRFVTAFISAPAAVLPTVSASATRQAAVALHPAVGKMPGVGSLRRQALPTMPGEERRRSVRRATNAAAASRFAQRTQAAADHAPGVVRAASPLALGLRTLRPVRPPASLRQSAPGVQRPTAVPRQPASVAPLPAGTSAASLPAPAAAAPFRSQPDDDDLRLGRWLEAELTRAVIRPSAGISGMDERLTPVFPGAPVG